MLTFSFGMDDLDDDDGFASFGGFGGCPGRQRRRPEPLKPGANLEVDLKCSLEDLYTGATKRMKVLLLLFTVYLMLL